MKRFIVSFGIRVISCALVFSAFTSRGSAENVLPSRNLEEVADRSDTIFVATCAEKKTEFRNGNVITTYKLKPSEIWKGTLSLDSNGLATMEDLGGILDGPVPLGQVSNLTTSLVEGQEVLFFTKSYQPNPAALLPGQEPIYTPGNPILFNRKLGRYTVLTHPKTGQRHVIQPELGPGGAVGNDAAIEMFLERKTKELEKRGQQAGASSNGRAATPGVAEFESLDAVRERVKTRLSEKSR